MPRLGVISDTHGLLRPEAIHALTGVNLIIHAGDIGGPEILATLSTLAAVVAVRGNVDTAEWTHSLPHDATIDFAGKRIYVLHDRKKLNWDALPLRPDIIISGHSHKPGQQLKDGILYLNPGAAGKRRFNLPVSVATVEIRETTQIVHFHDLLGGGLFNP